MRYALHETPIGPLLLAGRGPELERVCFIHGRRAPPDFSSWCRDGALFAAASAQLTAYFAGELRRFELALRVEGTPFQRAVWEALAGIEFGTTRAYGELAAMLGRPGASRAVGAANGANPLPVVLPCHRVIGADGRLTGFGGGLPLKRWLLRHEGLQLDGDRVATTAGRSGSGRTVPGQLEMF